MAIEWQSSGSKGSVGIKGEKVALKVVTIKALKVSIKVCSKSGTESDY